MHAAPFSGGTAVKKIKNGILNVLGVAQSLRMLRNEKPDAVVGMGAYLSVPVALAASLLRIPVFLHEQNVVPGKATRLLSHFARNIYVSFDATADILENARDKVKVTGNPVREMPASVNKNEILQFAGLSAGKKTVLVFGGSHGAKKINDAALEMLGFLSSQSEFQMVHVAGDFDYQRVLQIAEKNNASVKNYCVFPYLENILDYMMVSDFIVCRAGATTCAEVLSLEKPSVLIPYPYATGQHQLKNARELEKQGAAKVLLDEQVSGETLKKLIIEMLSDEKTCRAMESACKRMAKPDAACLLAGEIAAALVDKTL